MTSLSAANGSSRWATLGGRPRARLLLSKTCTAAIRDLVNENGGDIGQDLKLRIVPFTATYRLLPFGREPAVQPYIGAGVGIFAGATAKPATSWTSTASSSAIGSWQSGTAARSGRSSAACACRSAASDLGFEIALSVGRAGTSRCQTDFAGRTKIDLGGFSYLATFNIRF